MAKKRRRRRASLLTKGINLGVLALAFSPALQALAAGRWGQLVEGYSGGLAKDPQSGSGGTFRTQVATAWYGPLLAAIILKKAISTVRRMARV